MNQRISKILRPFYKRLPLNFYRNLISSRLILPFYHTVTTRPKPHISELKYYRTKEMFIHDLNFFMNNYKSVPIEALNFSSNAFHLSFDDGMSEVFTEIFPLLHQHKIHATFFVNSDFVDNKKMFYKHKISLIISELKKSEYYMQQVSNFLGCDLSETVTYIFNIKNEQIIDEIAAKIHISFADYLRDNTPYLTTDQLKILKKEGFTIGNHSKSHHNFNQLSFQDQKRELAEVNEFLKNKHLAEDLFFAFPFGDHQIENKFFNWMYNEGNIKSSFGVSGLKNDMFQKHHHRILMEYEGHTAEEIIKFEYFYYLLKIPFFKNKIKR